MKFPISISLGVLSIVLFASLSASANELRTGVSRTRTAPSAAKPVNARTAMDLQAQLEAEATAGQKKWSTLGMYNVTTDMAAPERPLNYTHVVGSMILYRLAPDISAFGTVSGKFISMGRQIRFEEESDSPDLNDVMVGLNLPSYYIFNGNVKVGARTQFQFPTSQQSRYEGIRWVWSGQTHADTTFFNDRLSLSSNLSAMYKQNTYDYSPTTDNLNTDYVFGVGLDLSLQIFGGLFVAVGASENATHHIDNIWTSNFTNQMVLGYAKGGWRAQFSYFNGSYPDDPTVDLWFVDKYRQLVRFTTSYSF